MFLLTPQPILQLVQPMVDSASLEVESVLKDIAQPGEHVVESSASDGPPQIVVTIFSQYLFTNISGCIFSEPRATTKRTSALKRNVICFEPAECQGGNSGSWLLTHFRLENSPWLAVLQHLSER